LVTDWFRVGSVAMKTLALFCRRALMLMSWASSTPASRSPLLFLALPLVWAAVYWAVWRYWLPLLLMPVGLLGLLVPLSFAWSAVLILKRTSLGRDLPERAFLVPSIALTLVAYASCLYASGAVFNLVPQQYKFGPHFSSLSRSTVVTWASVSVTCVVAAIALLVLQGRRTFGYGLASASIGMLISALALMGGLLVSGHMVFRA